MSIDYRQMIVEYDNSAKRIKEKIDFYKKQRTVPGILNNEAINSKIATYEAIYWDLIHTRNKILQNSKEAKICQKL